MTRIDNWCLDKLGFRPSYTLTVLVVFGGSAYIALWSIAWIFDTLTSWLA